MTHPNGTVLVSSYGRRGSSARVRLYDWMDYLDHPYEEYNYVDTPDNSITTLAGRPKDVLTAEINLRKLARKKSQRVLLSRKASPFSNGAIEGRILANSEYGVYDYDDAVMLDRAGGLRRPWAGSSVWKHAVASADLVVAGNDYLAEHAAGLNKNVSVIPSCVNHEKYSVKSSYAISTPEIVWIGSPSTERYLIDIAPALLRVNARTGARLKIISAGTASLGPLDTMVNRVEWSIDSFASTLSEADLGIMPLPDDEWSRGKCAYKLLQYGASGLPVIGSPIGANIDFLALCGADAPATLNDWSDSLEGFFAKTVDERWALGRRAREVVASKYSLSAWKEVWQKLVLA